MRQRLERHLKSWFVKPSSGMHLDLADGLRGVAILLVVISHGIYTNPDGPKIFYYISRITAVGWMGVPIFFVLSGFLISLPFLREREKDPRSWYQPGYATRRILKIFPPFYLTIIALSGFYYFRDKDPIYFKLGIYWATGIAHLIYFPKPLNNSFWSLWVELGFYTVLPLLFFALRGVRWKTAAWTIFAVLLIAPFISRLLTLSLSGDPGKTGFLEWRFPNFLDAFSWGVLFSALFLMREKDPARWQRYASLGYVGIAILIFTIFLFAVYGMVADRWQLPMRLGIEIRHFLPTFGAFLLLFLVFNPACRAARFFSAPILRFLGIVSYEWFLISQPIQIQFRRMVGGSHGSLPRFVMLFMFSFLTSLGIAIVVYHNFSLPILRWGRNRLKKNQPVVAAGSAAQ